MALRPRTQQVVGIIDELLQQSNRDQTFTPRNPVPRPSYMPYDQGSAGSSMRTFNKALGMFNVAGSPTPLMPPSLRSQREPFRPSVNLGDTSGLYQPGQAVPLAEPVTSTPALRALKAEGEAAAAVMDTPPDLREREAGEAQMRDLGGKATQAALLEAMQERSVTVSGVRHKLPAPFFVLATQNPIEQEGTYPLPEAQLDRFLFKIKIGYPSVADEEQILNRYKNNIKAPSMDSIGGVFTSKDLNEIQEIVQKVRVEDQLLRYIAQITDKTQPYAILLHFLIIIFLL